MARVTAENLEAIHVRAARGLLAFSTKDLASLMKSQGNPHMRIRNFEAGRAAPLSLRQELVNLFEECGIELQNGGKPGARVKDAEAFKSASSLLGRSGL